MAKNTKLQILNLSKFAVQKLKIADDLTGARPPFIFAFETESLVVFRQSSSAREEYRVAIANPVVVQGVNHTGI